MPTNDLDSESSTAGGEGLRFGTPSPRDGSAMWALADEVGLDLNSPYAYVMWGEHFADTSVVVHRDEHLVGFVTGFRLPAQPTTLFVWQIGVSGSARRLGLGSRMLDHLVRRLGAHHVEATVTPDNEASAALFRSLGARHDAPVSEDPLFPAELFPGGHDAEVRFRIGPLREAAARTTPPAPTAPTITR